ncbi:MAG: putative entry exclusion protein TrbK-alt [Altererythrobacter sp.]|nr:putative entry exclusion protein TrbK-alt [Altererythrobacter sp.]
MDTKLLARAAAIGLAAVAITVAIIQMREPDIPPPDPATIDAYAAPVDPLRQELRRCQSIGVEAANDRDCLRAWAENRRRFLAPGARPMERLPAPEDLAPDETMDQSAGAPVSDGAPPEHNPILKQHQSAAGTAN